MPEPGLVAGILALTTTLALAQTGPAPPSGRDAAAPTGAIGPRGSGAGRAGHHARDLRAQQAARTTLAQAVEAAEGRGQGRAIEAGFESRSGTGCHVVKVLGDDGKLVEHGVGAASGQVTGGESRPIEGFFARLRPTDARNARTTLRQVIVLAEQRAGGRAAEAEVEGEGEGDAVRHKITAANGDRTREVRVGADGQASVRD